MADRQKFSSDDRRGRQQALVLDLEFQMYFLCGLSSQVHLLRLELYASWEAYLAKNNTRQNNKGRRRGL